MILNLLAATILAATPARPATATYESLASLKRFQPLRLEPWSSRGLLGLIGSGGMYVFDLSHPKSPPRLVALERVHHARWSPDGGWLLFEVGRSAGDFRLVTLRVSDSARDTVYTGQELWPYVWASDGRIYGWTRSRSPRTRVAIDPPQRWHREHPEPRKPHAMLLIPDPFGFMPGPSPSEWSLGVPAMGHEGSMLLRNPFPGDSLYLVTILTNSARGRASVIDTRGRVVREIGDSLAEWTSVSADGRLVIGDQEVETPDGENLAHALLYVGDTEGVWSVRLRGAPDGVSPTWAPRDYVFCAQDPGPDVLRIGRVILEP
jgi:hypothetical protein